MDILVPNSWLKEYLETKATPEKIAETISLSGPSLERVQKVEQDYVYSIEVTTNRVDTAGVYGIAREAAAILPRFGFDAKLLPIKVKAKQKLVDKVDYLEAKVDPKLCPRFTIILIKNVKVGESPKWMKDRLEKVGVRSLNNVIDISNYLTHELGQPAHIFDYGKIKDHKMTIRASKTKEKITTLDNKKYTLPGGDIIIEDGKGRIIDLAGIMGGKLSAVDENTQNILLFVQTYDPINIRRTSMALAKRSEAASLFEKGLDPEQVEVAIRRGIDLFVEICKGEPTSQILDLYPNPYKSKEININVDFINERLGVSIPKKEIETILKSLSFIVSSKDKELTVGIPSFRYQDIDIPEDIVEEVARIYGYYKLPSELMSGQLPAPLSDSPFEFEMKVKRTLKGWGGIEIYTLSLVSKEKVTLSGPASWALKLRNPLGSESEYLRQSLAPSLLEAVDENAWEKGPYHIFEMSNIYLPVRGKLPEERMTLAGVFVNYGFRHAKGTVEALIKELRANLSFIPKDAKVFLPNHRLSIQGKEEEVGQFGILENGVIYYEFDMELLRAESNLGLTYKPSSKYPAQIEDISLVIQNNTYVADVIKEIKKSDKQVLNVELIDIYNTTRTFRVSYQNPDKTLTDKEVKEIRNKILERVKEKFGATPKS